MGLTQSFSSLLILVSEKLTIRKEVRGDRANAPFAVKHKAADGSAPSVVPAPGSRSDWPIGVRMAL